MTLPFQFILGRWQPSRNITSSPLFVSLSITVVSYKSHTPIKVSVGPRVSPHRWGRHFSFLAPVSSPPYPLSMGSTQLGIGLRTFLFSIDPIFPHTSTSPIDEPFDVFQITIIQLFTLSTTFYSIRSSSLAGPNIMNHLLNLKRNLKFLSLFRRYTSCVSSPSSLWP